MENLSWPINMDLVRSIAMINPRLAYMLVRGHQLVPRAYNIVGTFQAVTDGQTIQGALQERMYQDAWIREFRYTIKRKDFINGNAYKGQSDYFNMKMPYINVDFRIHGEDKYQLTNEFTPLENVCNDASIFGNAWVITRDQNLQVQFTNTRTFAGTEVPYEVTLTMLVYELSGCNFRAVDYTEALCKLRQLGVCPECGEK